MKGHRIHQKLNLEELEQRAAPATLYVSPTGDNANTGALDSPWATPGYASRQLSPGDTLVILGGRYVLDTYNEDIITPPSGAAGAWITIRGETGNRPVLAGGDNLAMAINLSGASYVRVENLEITHDDQAAGAGSYFREGVHIMGAPASHIVLDDLYIHHIDEFGLDFQDINDLAVTDCVISYCGFGAIGGPGASQGGWQNVRIENCTLSYGGHYYQGGDGSSRPYDRPDGFGIEPSAGPILIVNTTAEHNYGDGLDSKASNTTIRNCIVANNSCDGVKLWDGTSRVENTLIYGRGDGDSTPTPWAPIVIGCYNPNARFEIINTTVHDTLGNNYIFYAQYDETSTPINLTIRNSIFSGAGSVFLRDVITLTAENNLFYMPSISTILTHGNMDYTSNTISSLGTGNRYGDPLFTSPAWGQTGDYHLQSGSPAINAGATTGAPTGDLDGNTRDASPDIGAYEFSAPSGPQDIFFLHQSVGAGIMADHGGNPGMVSQLQALGHTFNDYSLWNSPPGGSIPTEIATLFADSNGDGTYGDAFQTVSALNGAATADVLMLKSCYYTLWEMETASNLDAWKQSFITNVAAYANQNPDQKIVVMSAAPLRSESGLSDAAAARARDWGEWLAGEFISTYTTQGNVYSFDLFDFYADAETHATNADALKREYCRSGGDEHPNDAGYTAAADAIVSYLQAAVLPGGPPPPPPPPPPPMGRVLQGRDRVMRFSDGDDRLMIIYAGPGYAVVKDAAGGNPEDSNAPIASIEIHGSTLASKLIAMDLDGRGTPNTMALGQVTTGTGESLGMIQIVNRLGQVEDTNISASASVRMFLLIGNADNLALSVGSDLDKFIVLGDVNSSAFTVGGNIRLAQFRGALSETTMEARGSVRSLLCLGGVAAGNTVTLGTLERTLLVRGGLAGTIDVTGSAAPNGRNSTAIVLGDLSGSLLAGVFGNVRVIGAFTGQIGDAGTSAGASNLLLVREPSGGGAITPTNAFARYLGYP
ncbi:MAG: right-handed parallel beta-helix repeat-containing protein [Planctomycetota bacterium]